MMKRIYILCIIVLCAVFFLSGCGYRIQRKASLPFREIKIGLIENRTFEPKLQDRLHRALTEEFLRQGLTVTPAAERTLTGVIHNYQMNSISQKNGITIEYNVVINADFKIVDGGGKITERKNISSPFIVSFTGSSDMGTLIASRDAAEEKAAKDIALEVAGALLFP
jgi:outer membrane lipopolysaccharide assembly protein LptE/RlpB